MTSVAELKCDLIRCRLGAVKKGDLPCCANASTNDAHAIRHTVGRAVLSDDFVPIGKAPRCVVQLRTDDF